MSGRLILIIILSIAALSSGWLMDRLTGTSPTSLSGRSQEPDYYMEDFTTITIGEDGLPLNKLYATYMEHNPGDDSLFLVNPKVEIFRNNNVPFFIAAEEGRATDDNEEIYLQGKVRMWEENEAGAATLSVDTEDVKILVLEEYAETDQNATITGKHMTITGQGVRANFKDSRLEILKHDKTIITDPDTI
jgi:lipopolysaccharide export system protein LptC